MSRHRNPLRSFLPVAVVLAAGCSSSDEPGAFFPTDGGGVPAPAEILPITGENAVSAAREAYGSAVAANGLSGIAATVGGSLGGGVAKPTGATLSYGGIPELVLMAPFGPVVLNCNQGGTISVSGDLQSESTLSLGDTINLDYEACNANAETITGRVEATVELFSENPDMPENFSLGLSILMINYQVTTSFGTETLNGDAGVVIDVTEAPTTLRDSVAGSSLTFDQDQSSMTVTNFATTAIFTLADGVYVFSVDARGTVQSTALPAAISYSTPVLLTGIEFGFPSAGEILVTGDNSSVRVIALDGTNVRLEIDSDGDGESNATVDTTWADISG